MAGEKQATKSGTKILPCTCEHEYQDQVYGKGRRVHNLGSGFSARCTVCGTKKTTS